MIRYHDFCDKELLKSTVTQELRKLGYKNVQKIRKNSQKSEQERNNNSSSKLFHNEIHVLASKIVNIKTGLAVEVPAFVADACAYIEENVSTEGIFRKAGSSARQREIKAMLEEGNGLSPEYHVIDVANILKLFFRELPEPLIPFHCHEMLVWCLQMKEKMTDCLLLSCLLLPHDRLNTLIYFMQFLHRVADHAEMNKMDINNLSIIMSPTLMPVEERKTENISQNGCRLKNHVKVIELLIKNSQMLGELPRGLEKKLPMPTQNSRSTARTSRPGRDEGVKKKRRSGSLTRVLSGLRRMVGKAPSPCKGQPVSNSHKTESFHSFGKKRKALENSVSFNRKKKHDDLQSLPSRSYLPKTPYMPFQQDILMPCNACGLCASPKVCYDPNISPEISKTKNCECEMEKKQLMAGYSKTEKKQKMEEDENCTSKSKNKGSKIEFNPVRRWSSMTSSRENKIRGTLDVNSFPSRVREIELLKDQNVESDCNDGSCDKKRIKSDEHFAERQGLHSGSFLMANLEQEYEKIKNKVSAIENQLMEEFGRLGATVEGNLCSVPSSASEDVKGLESVQTKYEKTLEEAERFSDSSADHLAKRLSRELKIRRSAEHKIIRSPSARKIGSLRRRSRDSFKQQKIAVNADECLKSNVEITSAVQSLKQEVLNASINSGNDSLYFHSSLKRGRPNTVRTGLRQPSPAQNTDVDSCSSRIQLTYVNTDSFPSNSVQTNKDAQSVNQLKSQSLVELPSEVPNAHSLLESGSLPAAWQSKLRQMSNFEFATPDVLKLKKSEKLCYSNATPMTPSQLKRASSFQESVDSSGVKSSLNGHNDFKKCTSFGNVSQENICDPPTSLSANQHWHSAASFLSDQNMVEQPATGRESIAKLRAQNAGKVLANVKLFEHNGKVRNEKVLSLCGTSRTELRHSINSHQKLVTPVGANEETARHSINNNKASRLRRSSHGDKPSPKTSLSDTESPHNRQGHFKRHGRLSAPGPGKHSQRYRKCFSPVNHKKNISVPMQWLEQGKENYIESSQGFTDHILKMNVNMKEGISDVFTPLTEKTHCIHASPLKDSNRMVLIKKGSPYDNSPTESHFGENVCVSSTGARNQNLQTPYTASSPMIKQPLTSGHSSLRPVSRRKKTGKPSPIRGVHKAFVEGTPKLSPRRQSPRLLLRSRLMSNACM